MALLYTENFLCHMYCHQISHLLNMCLNIGYYPGWITIDMSICLLRMISNTHLVRIDQGKSEIGEFCGILPKTRKLLLNLIPFMS